ncbi:MAG TPA: PAS domain S-box protein, partial [Symbiobacteriaceae bacterium]|nr:PAS domain S-box protein [Symbiobacteriaceae bacterium]
MSNGVPHDSIYPANAAESLAKYRLIMEASSDALLFVRSDGMIVDANHGAESMYGLDRSELLSMTIWDLRAPDTHSHIGIQMNVAMTSGAAFETMHRRKDGSLLAVEVSSRGASLMGVPVLLSVVRDVSRRKRQESIQTLLSEIDQLLRRDDSLESALAHVCEGLSGVLELPLLWIGLKVPDGSVLVKARGGPYGHMVESLAVRWDKTTGGTGPTGEALRTGRAQLVSLETAVPEQPWWPSVQELGLRHALIVPIVCRAEVLGTVSLYSRRPEGFPDDAVGLAQHFADHLGLMLIEARERDQIRLQTAALNAAANAIVIVDTAGRITWANEAFSVLTGYTADEVIGQNPRILKSGLTADSVFADLWSTIVAGNIWTGELMNRRKDGTIYVDQQTITPVRGSSGEITHFVGIKLDGTEKRQQEEHLRYLANHDPLTGFQNRRGFLELLNRRRGNPDELNALLMIDLDNFKLINDTFGHAAGDTALLTVAGVIRRFLRQSDCTARYGGDEFAVLLHGVNEDGAVGVAERIRRALQTSRVGE